MNSHHVQLRHRRVRLSRSFLSGDALYYSRGGGIPGAHFSRTAMTKIAMPTGFWLAVREFAAGCA
jgi:hypothetical protein